MKLRKPTAKSQRAERFFALLLAVTSFGSYEDKLAMNKQEEDHAKRTKKSS